MSKPIADPGLTEEEAVALFGCSPPAVLGSPLHRAVGKLEEALSAETEQYAIAFDVDQATRGWITACPDEMAVLSRFVGLMVRELAANNGKGNRMGWLEMTRKDAVAEVHWHASKLAVAAKEAAEEDPGKGGTVLARAAHADACRDTVEFAADVANCALMLLDCTGLLPAGQQDGEHCG
jgi:hypothetical protein